LRFPLSALILAKIDRTIAKEPAYQSQAPKYCLLAFGPEATTRVWLVLDGDRLFVDTNGNGDLTEKGKCVRVKTPGQNPASFEDVAFFGRDGQTKAKLQLALFTWFDVKQGKQEGRLEPTLSVSWNGRWYGAWGDEQSPLVFASRPQDAPILHIDGPLQMGFEVRQEHALLKKGKDSYELNVGVGAKGLGKGSFVHLKYWEDAVPEDAHPTAELEFPNKDEGGPPVRIQFDLKQRC
jgi:hypothetical protein